VGGGGGRDGPALPSSEASAAAGRVEARAGAGARTVSGTRAERRRAGRGTPPAGRPFAK